MTDEKQETKEQLLSEIEMLKTDTLVSTMNYFSLNSFAQDSVTRGINPVKTLKMIPNLLNALITNYEKIEALAKKIEVLKIPAIESGEEAGESKEAMK